MAKHEHQRAGITVAQLIERLKELPQDALLVTYNAKDVAHLSTYSGWMVDDGRRIQMPDRFAPTREKAIALRRGADGDPPRHGKVRRYAMVRLA